VSSVTDTPLSEAATWLGTGAGEHLRVDRRRRDQRDIVLAYAGCEAELETSSKDGDRAVASRSIDNLARARTIGRRLVTEDELVMSRCGTLTSIPERVSTMEVCASSSREATLPPTVRAYPPRDSTSNERSGDRVFVAVSRGASNRAVGSTGGLAGASMRTVSMRVVMFLPRGAAHGPSPIGPTESWRPGLERAVEVSGEGKRCPTRGPTGTLA
jgi:hypothetical protein